MIEQETFSQWCVNSLLRVSDLHVSIGHGSDMGLPVCPIDTCESDTGCLNSTC